MKKSTLIILMVAAFLATISLAAAIGYFTQTNTNTATYTANAAGQLKINGNLLSETTPIAWGEITPSQTYQKTLSFTNTGNTALTVTLSTSNLPAGFQLTWDANGASVAAGETVTGLLTLTTPAAMSPQSYSWTTTVRGDV